MGTAHSNGDLQKALVSCEDENNILAEHGHEAVGSGADSP